MPRLESLSGNSDPVANGGTDEEAILDAHLVEMDRLRQCARECDALQ